MKTQVKKTEGSKAMDKMHKCMERAEAASLEGNDKLAAMWEDEAAYYLRVAELYTPGKG